MKKKPTNNPLELSKSQLLELSDEQIENLSGGKTEDKSEEGSCWLMTCGGHTQEK